MLKVVYRKVKIFLRENTIIGKISFSLLFILLFLGLKVTEYDMSNPNELNKALEMYKYCSIISLLSFFSSLLGFISRAKSEKILSGITLITLVFLLMFTIFGSLLFLTILNHTAFSICKIYEFLQCYN